MNIAVAIQAQLLGQLIETLGKPGAMAAAASPLALKAGQTVEARVVGATDDGALELAIGPSRMIARVEGKTLDAQARQPGSLLTLKVEDSGAEPRLSLIALASKVAAETAVRTELTPQSPGLRSPATPAPLTHLVAEVASRAVDRQNSAAPLFANLSALVEGGGLRQMPALAQPVIQALLATRLDGNQPITAEDVRAAFQAAGVVQAPLPVPGSAPEASAPDVKALLTLLKMALEVPASRQEASPQTAPAPTRAQVPAALAEPGPRPEPPRLDMPVTALKPATPAVSENMPVETVMSLLSREAEQARERITLHQLAALPEAQARASDPQTPRALTFEVPVSLPPQTTMAGFRIEQEPGRRGQGGDVVDAYGIRFAIDAEGIGPVHAHVRLQGVAVSASIWAEDTGTHRLFVGALPRLEAALRDGGMTIDSLQVFAGKPAEPPPKANAGRLLDRRL